MESWRTQLKVDPIPSLLASDNEAICYFVRRDLLGGEETAVETLWQMPEVESILKRQLGNGAWKYPGGGKEHLRSQEDYDQLETFRALGLLVEKYSLTKRHQTIRRAADYLCSHQTSEGDFRGIYGNQYSPNYSAAIMELLIKAKYESDPRIEAGFRWLLALRQSDGGWALPLRTVGKKFDQKTLLAEPIQPDRAKPSSHLITGMVLRAFAAHYEYRKSGEAHTACKLLLSRFFAADTYSDRRAPSFWTTFSYPFWFTDLLSALDSLSLLGFTRNDAMIKQALDCFVAWQEANGLWRLSLLRMTHEKDRDAWISLAICRVLKRFYQRAQDHEGSGKHLTN
jgi:Squalene-hopene cyclase C-terminal domain